MFNHSNIYLNEKVDRVLRLFLVTPDMHRIHHSVVISEMNSNFGFNFPWWDRLFVTYRSKPLKEEIDIGVSEIRDFKKSILPHILILPFIPEEK